MHISFFGIEIDLSFGSFNKVKVQSDVAITNDSVPTDDNLKMANKITPFKKIKNHIQRGKVYEAFYLIREGNRRLRLMWFDSSRMNPYTYIDTYCWLIEEEMKNDEYHNRWEMLLRMVNSLRTDVTREEVKQPAVLQAMSYSIREGLA